MAGNVLTCGGEVRKTGPAGENKILASEMKRETKNRPTDQRVEENVRGVSLKGSIRRETFRVLCHLKVHYHNGHSTANHDVPAFR